MNNVNMGGMNAMGGPVGGGNPMMNNGAPGGPRQPINHDQKAQLNTYIYEYFLTNEMYDCARALVSSGQPMNLEAADEKKDGIMGNGADSMDGDSKDGLDSKRPDDLPAPKVPQECPDSCFLYEWWCLFWDMFSAQRGKGETGNTRSYLQYTQAQSRMRQDQQQQQLRQMNARPDMNNMNYQLLMRNQQQNGGLNMNPNDIARKAMQNNRNTTPQQMQMLQQQQKQQQMQRDPSDGNRPQSPGSAENAPSPSKRPRLEGAPFNPQQQSMMPNGRGQGQGLPAQQVGNNGPSNPIQLPNGFDASNLTPQQFQAFQQSQNPGQQQKSLAAYQAGLTQHTQGQMPNKGMQPGGPQNQGSPMMSQGQDGGAIAGYYNAGEMGPGMRGPPGGQPGGGGNHALQDYQMQLMLLEQQNKKRLMMARQEQDSMAGPGREGMPGPGGPGPGPNGQPFQQGTSPQGRPGASPNPSEQMKRGTPHMSNAGVPSPLPEGQSRGSPGQMGFMPGGNQVDPNMNPQFNGMNGMNMAMANGMRPPSSHPAGFNGQMNPQQMQMARQAQAQQQAGWQNGANGPQMMPQPSQGPPQQQGTPQQRNMPPPSVPAAPATANGRTQPSSPQQGAAPPTPSQANKANPKGKKDGNKDTKPKKGGKKGQAPTPATDPEPATPTPATPITPVHPKSFNGQNGAVQQPMTNGQPPAATTAPPQQPDPLGGMGAFDNSGAFDLNGFQFANPNDGNMDVLQDFDFDSFLHQDGEGVDNFSFDTNFMDPGEIGAD